MDSIRMVRERIANPPVVRLAGSTPVLSALENVLATHFFDLDGTLLHYHTHEWLPGAREMLFEKWKSGDQIIFMTMRGPQDAGKAWSIEETMKLLQELPFPYRILFSVDSPRIMHDDSEIQAHPREQNSFWK